MRRMEAPVMKMVMLLMGLPLLAQQVPRPRPHPPRPEGGRTMAQNPHFMAKIYQVRVSRIQQVLGIPEDRARLVAERWARWDQEHMDRGQKAAELRRQFNEILMGPEKEEEKSAKLKPLVDLFVALRTQQEAGRKQFEEDVRAGLTPAQQARLILVMDEIQQRLRDALREAQGR